MLDLSFWSREFRAEYRALVEECGRGRYVPLLVVFRVPGGGGAEEERVLWERIEGRRREVERRVEVLGKELGGEGMSPSREELRDYVKGFEWPSGEGEVVVDVV